LEGFKGRKIFAREPSAKLRSNFASIGIWILLKESSDIVQQTPPK
jgi:flagellar biosynthesis regulator FlaF